MVMTALGTSRVWVTLGYGILNEVYWPATGQPQVRDLGFIVAGPSGWFEVKRVNRYQISMPEDCVRGYVHCASPHRRLRNGESYEA
jgi:glucoamylase